MSLLWDDPDEAINECLSMHANYRIDLPHLRAQRALSDVINGKSIRAACREHHTSGKDFDSVLHGYFQKIRVHLHPDIYQDLGLQKNTRLKLDLQINALKRAEKSEPFVTLPA